MEIRGYTVIGNLDLGDGKSVVLIDRGPLDLAKQSRTNPRYVVAIYNRENDDLYDFSLHNNYNCAVYEFTDKINREAY